MGFTGAGCANGNGGSGATVACTASYLAGQAVIVAVKWCDTSNACTTATGSDTYTITDGANTYGQCVRLDSSSSTDRRAMVVCIAQNVAANASTTVTLTVTSSNAVNLAG